MNAVEPGGADRSEIDRVVQGRTTVSTLSVVAEKYGERPALSWIDRNAGWSTYTWAEARAKVMELAAALVSYGLRRHETVAIMAPNTPEHVLADQAVVHAGGLPFTVYGTSSPEQIEYLARHSGARFAIVQGQAELDRWQPVLSRSRVIERVVVIDATCCPDGDLFLTYADLLGRGHEVASRAPDVLARRLRQITAQDPVALVYTSGTTGEPKGVVLTHYNVLYKAESWRRNAGVAAHPVSVSYLPYAHVAERVNGLYVPVHLAGHVYFCSSLAEFPDVLAEVRPHSLTAVPGIWAKLRTRISDHLSDGSTPGQVETVNQAMRIARNYLAASADGRTPAPSLVAEYQRAERETLAPLRRIIGLDRCLWCASSAAPADEGVQHYFAGLGIRLSSVYGMTETTGGITVNRRDAFRVGTVGQAVTGCEVRTAEDGEIMVRGPLITPGYYGDPAASAALFDERGWARTGDLGAIDEDGYITLVGRKKDLIVTIGGENIAPRRIEELLEQHPAIAQAMACGDGRRYITALISVGSPEIFASNPEVVAQVADAVARANSRLARVQQIKKWRVVPGTWSVETGELTPTFKLKRRVVQERHAELIDEMYAETPTAVGGVR